MSLSHKIATDDNRIKEIKELRPPETLLDAMQASDAATENIIEARAGIPEAEVRRRQIAARWHPPHLVQRR